MGYHTSMIAPEHHPFAEIWTCPTGGRHEIIFSTFCQFIKNKIKNSRYCGWVRQNKTKKSNTVGKLDVVNVLSQLCEATVYSECYVANTTWKLHTNNVIASTIYALSELHCNRWSISHTSISFRWTITNIKPKWILWKSSKQQPIMRIGQTKGTNWKNKWN